MEQDNAIPSLERMNYTTFRRKFEAMRPSAIPHMILDLRNAKLELPDSSSIHTVRGFLEYPTELGEITPDTTNPFFEHEEWRKFLHIETAIANVESRPFPVTDRFVYQPGQFRGIIQHYFTQQREFYRTMDDVTVDKARNILACHEYAPLLRINIRGVLTPYRKFDILLRSILNKVVSTTAPRYHFIEIPLSDKLYTRNDFTKTALRITQATLRGNTDPSYYFLIHLIGFLFNEVAEDHAVPVQANDIGYLSEDDMLSYKTNSLFNRLSDQQLDTLHVIFTHDNRGVIYNLGDLKAFTTSLSFVDRVIRHVNTLKLVAAHGHDETTVTTADDTSFSEIVNTAREEPTEPDTPEEDIKVQSQTESPDLKPVSNTVLPMVPRKPVTAPVVETPKPAPPVSEDKDTAFVRGVNHAVAETVELAGAQTSGASDTPAKRADTLMKRHLQVKIGGKTIAEHLATPDPTITDNHLDFIQDDVPDASMTKSSVAALDATYIKHMATKDLAKTLVSLTKGGYFVTEVKETPIVDKFNRITDYRVKMVDLDGRQHSFNFQFPTVDENGLQYVNGIVSRMVKQNIDVPICKISDSRVSLSSNFNKTIVSRSQTVAHNFGSWINKYLKILIRTGMITVEYGRLNVGTRVLPYDYTVIAQRYLKLTAKNYAFNLNYDTRFVGLDDVQKHLETLEFTYGTYCGTGAESRLFWDQYDVIHELDMSDQQIRSFHFVELLAHLFGKEFPLPSMTSEWTELQIVDLSIPVVFVLGYRYGLQNILKLIKLKYKFIPAGTKATVRVDDVAIKFADGTLIFPRYPLIKSLIASGLGKWDLTKHTFIEFNAPDAYFTLLEARGISPNYLKGITSFFDFFVDPITEDILRDMHEPTNPRDLLLRATEMLSTMAHYPASSMRHHRLRGYERQSSFLYNEVTRKLASWRERYNLKDAFSIHPKSVFSRLIGDQTVINTDVINPIHELKGVTHLTYGGSNGRTAQSFVVNDRVYAEDARGIISEATPDSGKVAMTAYTSANPRIRNLRGMVDPGRDDETLDPSNMLSVSGMLMPGGAQDDGKRLNFINVQLTHHVPCDNSEVSHVRTGFELTIAHRVSDNFAVAAVSDGKVLSVDPKTWVIVVQYADKQIATSGPIPGFIKIKGAQALRESGGTYEILIGTSLRNTFSMGKSFTVDGRTVATVIGLSEGLDLSAIDPTLLKTNPDVVKAIQSGAESSLTIVTLKIGPSTIPGDKTAYRYGPRYTSVSGSYIKQDLVLTVAEGDTVNRGDILIYNKGFFAKDPGSRQVRWKHGVMSTVALIEKAETLEDGSIISKPLGERLEMHPAHKRTITITNTDVIKKVVDLGDQVETTDPIIVFEEGDLGTIVDLDNAESAAFWRTLDQRAPKCDYHGHIADVEIFYSCPFETLHPTIQALVKRVERRNKAVADAMKGTTTEGRIHYDSKVAVGTKYHGVEFMDNTVVIEFTISENLLCGVGDKCVIGGANKTVVSSVMERQFYTQSGLPIDAMYGCAAAAARIVNSIYIMGIGNRLGRAMQSQAIDKYFS